MSEESLQTAPEVSDFLGYVQQLILVAVKGGAKHAYPEVKYHDYHPIPKTLFVETVISELQALGYTTTVKTDGNINAYLDVSWENPTE